MADKSTTADQRRWVERPLEPVVKKGLGMHTLGFVPTRGPKPRATTPLALPAAPLVQEPMPLPGPRHRLSLPLAKEYRTQQPKLQLDAATATADQSDLPEGPHATPTEPKEQLAEAEASANGGHGVVRGPADWKRGRPLFALGNYPGYYGYRTLAKGDVDPRLGAVVHHLDKENPFAGKEVLDIGCNAGRVALEVGYHFGARRVVGVDIDSDLVWAAQAAVSAASTNGGSSSSGCAKPQDSSHPAFEFRAEDILQSPLRRPPTMRPERFDVILCLSITKWVHYAYGDAGVRNLFRRCHKRLRNGGLFVLEPQDWMSYKKKRHLTREIRQMVSTIEMRPESFDNFLVGELGFEPVAVLSPPAEEVPSKGFQRTIRLFRKPAGVAVDNTPEGAPPEVPAAAGSPAPVPAPKKKRKKANNLPPQQLHEAPEVADEQPAAKKRKGGDKGVVLPAKGVQDESTMGAIRRKKAKKAGG